MPRDTGVAWRHLRSIMTRCARGRGRESPKKAVKRKEQRKGEREEGGRKRESWRAFLVTFRLSEPPPSYLHPLSLSFSFATPSSGKPVASLLPSLPPLTRHSPFATSSSGNSCYFLPACYAKRNSRGSSLYAEFPGIIPENLVPSLSQNVHFSGFRGPASLPLMNLRTESRSSSPQAGNIVES